MFRFLIYIFTFCLLNFSCTHFEKKDTASLDPLLHSDRLPTEVTSFEFQTSPNRDISAETTSLEKEFENLTTTDDLEALIIKIDKDYKLLSDADRLLAIEISLLRPFRSYNAMLNQNSIGMPGTDFLTLVSDIDTSAWKKNSIVNAYLNEPLEKSKRKIILPTDVQNHYLVQVLPRVRNAYLQVSFLKAASYKSVFCTFSCKTNKSTIPQEALRAIALFNAKLGFQAAYKYSDLFSIRKSSNAAKQSDEALKLQPNLVTFKNTDFEIKSKTKDIYSLFGISINSSKWLKFSYDSYTSYTARTAYLEPAKADMKKAFMGTQQFVHQGKIVFINMAALFDKPNPDLKNFLPTKFEEKSKKATEWDIDSYKAIFPNLRSNEEVPFHIGALAENFPGGLPFPLSIVFNPATIKTKK